MKISHPVTCDRLLRPKVSPNQPEIWCIALTKDYDLIHIKALFKGYTPRFPQCLRYIAEYSLRLEAPKIIIVSTCPTDPIIPGEKEAFWTEKLQESLRLLEIHLLDHILISAKTHLSFLHWEPEIFEGYKI